MTRLTSNDPPLRSAWLAVAAVMLIMSAHAATHALDGLIDAVIHNGPDAELPAHLSVVLGVSPTEQKTAVKQAVIREGTFIRTFNVCKVVHEDVVVILTYDEQHQSTQAYLLSSSGVLRKAVTYQTGSAARVRSPAEARDDFARELKFWTGFTDRTKAPGTK